MFYDTKPPLDEALLIHYGKKGMKWGVRKTRPDEAERKARFSPNAKKAAAAVAVAGGAAAAAYLLSRHGNVSAATFSRATLKPTASDRLNELRRMQGENFAKSSKLMNQTLHFNTEKNTWTPDRVASTSRAVVRRAANSNSRPNPNLRNIADIQNALKDPSFVWNL